ncbi:MAG: 2-hydroxyhepta-2,4-diene-1,7-dioate isomerase [Bacteroidetes bacterium]|nr:2-hydroxyhepta-2,4-diene-1,7-dioate isomerase [Bacteroidota bacterium]
MKIICIGRNYAAHVREHKNGKAIPVQFAADYYDEITVGIDFTARDLQSKLKEKGLPWEKAKGFDHSAVIGKFIPKNGMDMKNLDFHLTKNEQIVQQGNTGMMMHAVDAVIAHVSQYFMLKTGDLIFTGTPEGVGAVSAGDELKGYLGEQMLFRCKVC